MFSAVLHIDVLALTLKLVVGRLVGILETAPATNVVNKNCAEVGGPPVDNAEQILKRFPPLDTEPAFPGIRESVNDDQAVIVRVAFDGGVLIIRRVLLMFC
jgi:hypothetical protein